MRFCIFLWLLGCGRPTVSGRVLNVSGQPIAGATVTNTTGALCSTDTIEDGSFGLTCPGSDLRLAVVLDGWFSEEVAATGEGDRSVADVHLLKKPREYGLYVISGSDYVPLSEPGRVVRQLSGNTRVHRLKRDGMQPNVVPAGASIWVDHSAEPWRMWRVREDGVVHEEHKVHDGRWETDFGEQPKSEQERTHDLSLLRLTLEPGDYFVADWPQGKFRKTKADKEYSGHWVRAE